MTLAEKIRYLREVEGSLRGLGRPMTQQELVRALSTDPDQPQQRVEALAAEVESVVAL